MYWKCTVLFAPFPAELFITFTIFYSFELLTQCASSNEWKICLFLQIKSLQDWIIAFTILSILTFIWLEACLETPIIMQIAVQGQKAVSVYFTSKRILPFKFAERDKVKRDQWEISWMIVSVLPPQGVRVWASVSTCTHSYRLLFTSRTWIHPPIQVSSQYHILHGRLTIHPRLAASDNTSDVPVTLVDPSLIAGCGINI